MKPEGDTWLTAVRVRRLGGALAAVRSHPPPGVPARRMNDLVWRRCGGPLGDIEHLVDVLLGAGLLERRGSLVHVTKRGRLVATQDHQHGGRLLGRALVEAGYFREQSRRLLASSELSDEGGLVCRRSAALRSAAQLTAVLRRWEEVELDSHFRVPKALVQELLEGWSLRSVPVWAGEQARNKVGDRAEAYSYRLELEASEDPSDVAWVSLDDDSLGYDIRNSTSSPARCIEVKGSGRSELRFFMSANEWRKGHKLGDQYEIQYWGEVSLGRTRSDEYIALRDAGYPLVFRNLKESLAACRLLAAPSEYEVTSPGSGRPQRGTRCGDPTGTR